MIDEKLEGWRGEFDALPARIAGCFRRVEARARRATYSVCLNGSNARTAGNWPSSWVRLGHRGCGDS